MTKPPFAITDATFEIVGVAQNAMHDQVKGQALPEIYIPYSIHGLADTLLVHTQGDPMQMAKAVREQIYQLDGSQFVDDTQTLPALIDRWVYSRGRLHLWLMGVFASIGLMLAVIGVYGLMSQFVAQQRQEIGVRLAIGAQFADILQLVIRRGVILIASGIAIGLSVTAFLLRRFGAELRVANPFDPSSLGGACFVLFVAGLLACLIPAIRAGRLNPVEILRPE
jgi:ABC-type antimicrobial peptide transport system permease subunit